MGKARALPYKELKLAKERQMSNPTAAMVVIGDEILSGRTRDSNMHFLAGALNEIGIRLREVRVVADEPDEIITAVNSMRQSYHSVFTSGGIGPTHDDITADAIAATFGVAIGVRADAATLLQAHYDRMGQPFNVARQRMARIPEGALLIDNPVSTPPGFTLGNVHVMAGVPTVFQAMVASVLPSLVGGEPLLSQNLRLLRGEGDIAADFGALALQFPELSMGSYPFQQNGQHGTNLVVRGTDATKINNAMAQLHTLFDSAHAPSNTF